MKKQKEQQAVMTVKCVACGEKQKGFYTDFPLCPKCGSPMLVESISIGRKS